MDRKLLARALGATAQLALGKSVRAVRLVFCDAAPIDAGWISPDDLLGRTEIKGRGGTVLQDGVDFVARLGLPEATPLLVITDGLCDPLRVARPHAFLVAGRHGTAVQARWSGVSDAVALQRRSSRFRDPNAVAGERWLPEPPCRSPRRATT